MNDDLFFQIPNDWQSILSSEMNKEYMIKLEEFLKDEIKKVGEHNIYPPKKKWFYALKKTSFDNVKVVILGQDPYHGKGQAHGLSFSVPSDTKIPPSLRNMLKEIKGFQQNKHTSGDLTSWAKQGVLLLNATLTVNHGDAGSHQGQGWEDFTNTIIKYISDNKEHVVFMLWGKFAHEKESLINNDDNNKKHTILKASHPSPLSAYRGHPKYKKYTYDSFTGCNHFSKCNEVLKKHGQEEINWILQDSCKQDSFGF